MQDPVIGRIAPNRDSGLPTALEFVVSFSQIGI
jgi:hypothetical protein